MNPSCKDAEPSSSFLQSSSLVLDLKGKVVTELSDDDVLLGRGVEHQGNIQFREIIAGRRNEYLNVRKRQHKDWIARQVMSAVARKGGRFLKRIESSLELQQLGLTTGATAWQIADESSVLLKIKQALRERESGEVGKRQTEMDSSLRPTKKHQPDASLQGSVLPASIEGKMPSNVGLSSETRFYPQANNASDAVSTADPEALYTATLLREVYRRMVQQGESSLSSQTHPLALGLQQNASAMPLHSEMSRSAQRNDFLAGSYRPPSTSVAADSGRSSLDSLLASLPRQGQLKNLLSSITSFAPEQHSGMHTLRQASQASMQNSDVAALETNQTPAAIDSTSTLSDDRIRVLLAALQGSGDRTHLSVEHNRLPATQAEDTTRGDSIIRGMDVLQQQRPGRLIPSFFPDDLQTETTGIVALCNSTSLDKKGDVDISLSFSLTEMLILSVLCSFGIPAWNPSKLDRGEVFSAVKKSTNDVCPTRSYDFSWYDFSLLLIEAAKDWRDHRRHIQSVPGRILPKSDHEDRAVENCGSYGSDCRQLASTALCILEKVRRFLEVTHGDTAVASRNVAGPCTDDLSTSWMESEIQRWAETLGCQGAKGFPVAYTTSDFLVSYPEYKENAAFKLASSCDKKACETIWNQIVLLSRARSVVTSTSSVDSLIATLERRLADSRTQSWEEMPRWWSLNTSYFDVELLKVLLLDGYVGVLSAPLSAPQAAVSMRYIETMTFSKLGIVSKRPLQERFEQLARHLAQLGTDQAFLEQLQRPLDRKRLEERIQALKSL